MTSPDPRHGTGYKNLRVKLRRQYARAQAPCWLCGRPINYALKYPDPGSFSLDHKRPVMEGGHSLDPAAYGPSHLHCNQSRGASAGNARRGARKRAPWTCARCGRVIDPGWTHAHW